MTNPIDNGQKTIESDSWELNALTQALGELSVTVSDSLSIGRGSDNDVVLGSKQVSRNHAVLSVLDGQLYVKDLDSSNGTFINDERIESNKSSMLTVDDKIGFAGFNFQVNTSASDTEAEILNPVTEDSTASMDTNTEETVATERLVEVPTTKEPVVKKTDIEEILPTEENAAPASSQAATTPITPTTEASSAEVLPEAATTTTTAPTTPIESDSAVEQPLVHEEPVINDEPVIRKEPVLSEEPIVSKEPIIQPEHDKTVQPDHDKTTKTELQEEADPEVLHAKQAATAQFSGTANLGQKHDLGTTGNNAMDQAVDNPATTGRADKKSSGGWFIWVFVALIIIGLALWLFNMGGTGAGA